MAKQPQDIRSACGLPGEQSHRANKLVSLKNHIFFYDAGSQTVNLRGQSRRGGIRGKSRLPSSLPTCHINVRRRPQAVKRWGSRFSGPGPKRHTINNESRCTSRGPSEAFPTQSIGYRANWKIRIGFLSGASGILHGRYAALEVFMHCFGGVLMYAAMARQYPLKTICEQFLHRMCLLRPRIPTDIAEGRQSITSRRPRQVIACE